MANSFGNALFYAHLGAIHIFIHVLFLLFHLKIGIQGGINTGDTVEELDECFYAVGLLREQQLLMAPDGEVAEDDGKCEGSAEEAEQFHVDQLILEGRAFYAFRKEDANIGEKCALVLEILKLN
jgi:hypothetical protein